MHSCIVSILKKRNEAIVIYTQKIFSILLSILADSPNSEEIHLTISELAKQSGFENSQGLFSNVISILLIEYLEKKEFSLWSKGNKEKKKFEIIVRNSREGLGKFLQEVLEIIRQVTNPSLEIELRMDMMVLLEFILKEENMKETLISHSPFIISQILAPAIVWRIGKTEAKFRKAAVINLIHLTNFGLVKEEILCESLPMLLPSIKSCMSDSWAPDLRFVCAEFLEKLLAKIVRKLPSFMFFLISEEFFADNYAMLLERLDDAKDEIRIKAAQVLVQFLSCAHGISESTLEYIVKNLLIHLDDANESLAKEILNGLVSASSQDLAQTIIVKEVFHQS